MMKIYTYFHGYAIKNVKIIKIPPYFHGYEVKTVKIYSNSDNC